MNKTIAIIAAMDEEAAAVREKMTNTRQTAVYGKEITVGKLGAREIVLAKSGVGKVNAARTAQLIIDKYSPAAVINIGSAGCTTEKLGISDVVISESCVQHDFDLTAFGREKGFVTDVGKYIKSDEKITDAVLSAAEKISGGSFRVVKGIIASGDSFVSEAEIKKEIFEQFGAVCVEMEGAAVAQVCSLCGVPFTVVRSVSDALSGDITQTFEEFLETASKRCAEVLANVIDKI